MTSLVAAALCFTALHLFVSGTRVRGVLVARLGAAAYRGLFSLASAGLLAWLIVAYGQVRQPLPTEWGDLRIVAAVLMLVAFFLVVAGLFTRGPTVVGGERLLKDGALEPRGIHRVTRHPFLWGVALWAVVHLVFNPALAQLVFFGTFLVIAVVGTASIDAKRAAQFGDAWTRYAALTSNVPFVAIGQGRNRLVASELGVPALVATVVVFGAFVVLHARLFGLPAL